MLNLFDGFWFELGRVLAGVSLVIAVLLIVFVGAIVHEVWTRYQDRKARKSGCVVCHKPAEFYTKYQYGQGYVCREHTRHFQPAQGAHGHTVPVQ